jgi:protein FRG1
MVKPLTFKGDKTKKRKRPTTEPNHGYSDKLITPANALSLSDSSTKQIEPLTSEPPTISSEDSWATPNSVDDILGPVILAFATFSPPTLSSDPEDLETAPTRSTPVALACDLNGKVFASLLENTIENDVQTAEPHDVRQVWVATRIAGTGKWGFKGHHGRYLGADKLGILSADAMAMSPAEEFTPVFMSAGGFILRAASGMNLGLTNPSSGLGTDLRCMAEEQMVVIRGQSRFMASYQKAEGDKAERKISTKELEQLAGRKLELSEVKTLKKARKEGGFHEALLDVRIKGKHDKYS